MIEPLAPAGGANTIKDPMLRDLKRGKEILEIRKGLVGQALHSRTRTSVARISLGLFLEAIS
jgi:hypothetical protein